MRMTRKPSLLHPLGMNLKPSLYLLRLTGLLVRGLGTALMWPFLMLAMPGVALFFWGERLVYEAEHRWWLGNL